MCPDCGCLRFRQHVGSYQCFGGTCCLHLQSQSDGLLRSWGGGQPRGCGQVCICGGSSEAMGGGGDDNRLLHCMFSIAMDKCMEALYNTVFVRLICFNPVRHHSHIIILTILFSLGTWLHSSVGIVTRLSRHLTISVPRTAKSVEYPYSLQHAFTDVEVDGT